MKRLLKNRGPQIMNVGLRFTTLAAKLALTVYMGKYFSLADIGIYGLVFGVVMTTNLALGMRFDFIVVRELVDAPPFDALRRMRDQAVFYLTNYIPAALAMAALYYQGMIETGPWLALCIFGIIVAENFATMTFTNMNSMRRQVMANCMFFIRSGLWILPVIGLGVTLPEYRNVETVLLGWIIGLAVSLTGTFLIWRDLPWKEVFSTPPDWRWIFAGVRKSFFVWLGTLGLAAGIYLDRFVVNYFLGIDQAGVATFYFSFANALLTLAQSGVLSFAYPKFISFHRQRAKAEFRHEARQTFWHIGLFTGVMSIIVGAGVPLLGHVFEKPALVNEALTLWLMLLGTWIRCIAETHYYILFARHQDRAIWLGNLLFLIPALGGNFIFVPLLGLSGIGYSAVLASTFLLLWRWHYAHKFKEIA